MNSKWALFSIVSEKTLIMGFTLCMIKCKIILLNAFVCKLWVNLVLDRVTIYVFKNKQKIFSNSNAFFLCIRKFREKIHTIQNNIVYIFHFPAFVFYTEYILIQNIKYWEFPEILSRFVPLIFIYIFFYCFD